MTIRDRDIFTLRFLKKPSLKDLLNAVPLDVAASILGVPLRSARDLDRAISSLTSPKSAQLFEQADLVLHGERLEKEDVEKLAREHGVICSKKDSSYKIINGLIQKIGYAKAQKILGDLLAPGEIDPSGTFADFDAPPVNLSKLELTKFMGEMESTIEAELSRGLKEIRRVKVRPEIRGKYLVVGIYFQRPDIDGKHIGLRGGKKKLEQKMFERSAGTTYFVVKPHQKRSRIMFKSPDMPLVKTIKTALGQTVWGDTSAVSTTAAVAYNLDVFKSPDFVPRVVDKHRFEVERILLSEINVQSASGSLIRVKNPERRGDAQADFREIAAGATVLVEQSAVESVTIKFLPVGDRRRLLAKAEIYPNKIKVDDQNWELLNAHLDDWGVLRE